MQDMEIQEDNIIKQKVNSLDGLPEGYEPNLESKWNIIETGLDENKRKKKIIGWYRIAIAAMLLIIGGGSLFLLRTDALQPTQVENKQFQKAITPTENLVSQAKNSLSKKESKKYIYHPIKMDSHETLVSQPLVSENKMETDSFTRLTESAKVIAEITLTDTKTKRTRFVELDFNDQPLTTNHSNEPLFASQFIRFKFGTGNASAAAGASDGPNFKLSKTISN